MLSGPLADGLIIFGVLVFVLYAVAELTGGKSGTNFEFFSKSTVQLVTARLL